MKTKQKAAPGTFSKVMKRIRNHWNLLGISILCAAVNVFLTLYIPVVTGRAIDHIIGKGQVNLSAVLDTLTTVLVCAGLAAAAQWVMNICNNRMTFSIVRDIRNDAMRKIEILPLSYLDSHPHGEIVSRVIADVDQFADGLLMGFTQLFSGILTILGTLAVMFRVNYRIALLVVLITPLSLFVASFIAKNTFNMFKLQSETRGEQTAFMEEMIGNREVVKAFSYEKRGMEIFDEINERVKNYSLRATFFSSITNPSTRFVNNLVYAAVALTGALSALRGRLSVGQLTAFLSYANQYTKPFNEISGVVTEFQNALACAGRIFELIEAEPQTPEPENAVVLGEASGKVETDHVWFSYVPDRKLIEDLSISVAPGQRIAIVGPTGCGKTTIINLLMRFYDVDQGCIRVMDHDIREVTRRSLRENYGMVLQDTWLKNGTIRENLCMGKPDASEEEIIAAAKAAHAHSFIRRLPQGYDTPITESGGGLSQGQKQLLCIARVMLCLPPMLILDEATSSIDTRTEILIQNAFARMMEGRTSFIVAHRLSTIREADLILVMRDGHIVEQGKHQELLDKNGFYAEIYNAQFTE
ncbi:MAG: ABC transporter ATP-binding protein [Flexilinea sp.]|nr:ABC transporter ATP-binding protein [Flexilinea sp.]